jgi:hypothetical protein
VSAPHVTGVQAATQAVVALVAAWRVQFSPREYAVVLDLVARIADAELRRTEKARRRWVA